MYFFWYFGGPGVRASCKPGGRWLVYPPLPRKYEAVKKRKSRAAKVKKMFRCRRLNIFCARDGSTAMTVDWLA